VVVVAIVTGPVTETVPPAATAAARAVEKVAVFDALYIPPICGAVNGPFIAHPDVGQYVGVVCANSVGTAESAKSVNANSSFMILLLIMRRGRP
jgi:hypothetical protein